MQNLSFIPLRGHARANRSSLPAILVLVRIHCDMSAKYVNTAIAYQLSLPVAFFFDNEGYLTPFTAYQKSSSSSCGVSRNTVNRSIRPRIHSKTMLATSSESTRFPFITADLSHKIGYISVTVSWPTVPPRREPKSRPLLAQQLKSRVRN